MAALALSLVPWVLGAGSKPQDLTLDRLVIKGGIEIQDEDGGQAVFIDKGGLTIGAKGSNRCMITPKMVAMSGDADYQKPAMILGVKENAAALVLNADGKSGISLNAADSK